MPRPLPLAAAAALLALPLALVGCDDGAETTPATLPHGDGVMDDAATEDGPEPVVGASGENSVSLESEADFRQAGFTEEVSFEIPGMHCEFSCAPKVEAALAGVPGVAGVETNVEARTAKFHVSDEFDVETAKLAVAEAASSGEDFTVAQVN